MLLSKNTSKFWSLWLSETNSNNASSSNLTADQISEKFKTNFIDSASNNVSEANFLHKLESILRMKILIQVLMLNAKKNI